MNIGYSPITPGHNFLGTQSPGMSTHHMRSMSPNFQYTKIENLGSPNSNLSSDVINSNLGSASPAKDQFDSDPINYFDLQYKNSSPIVKKEEEK